MSICPLTGGPDERKPTLFLVAPSFKQCCGSGTFWKVRILREQNIDQNHQEIKLNFFVKQNLEIFDSRWDSRKFKIQIRIRCEIDLIRNTAFNCLRITSAPGKPPLTRLNHRFLYIERLWCRVLQINRIPSLVWVIYGKSHQGIIMNMF